MRPFSVLGIFFRLTSDGLGGGGGMREHGDFFFYSFHNGDFHNCGSSSVWFSDRRGTHTTLEGTSRSKGGAAGG